MSKLQHRPNEEAPILFLRRGAVKEGDALR
jgi:hypothetical protein